MFRGEEMKDNLDKLKESVTTNDFSKILFDELLEFCSEKEYEIVEVYFWANKALVFDVHRNKICLYHDYGYWSR